MAPRRDAQQDKWKWARIILPWLAAALILEALMIVVPLLANLG